MDVLRLSTPNIRATNLAIKDGRVLVVDDAEEYQRGPATKVVDLQGRVLCPFERFSSARHPRWLSYNMELRWMACPRSPTRSHAQSRRNARRPVNGCGLSAVGPSSNLRNAGCRHWTKSTTRLPIRRYSSFTCIARLAEQAALRACGYTKDTPNPPAGNSARQQRQSYRAAHRPTERRDSLR